MTPLKHYYQIDIHGLPIQHSNVNLHKPPIQHGKGMRYLQYFIPKESLPCCSTGSSLPSTSGRKWRYYIRFNPISGLPIAGSLEKHLFPPHGHWIEAVGKVCC